MTNQMQELKNTPTRKSTSSVDWVPRGPGRYILVRHRSPINPVYQLLTSASEDTIIKKWEYETGEYERTLKEHTMAAQLVAFDEKGNHESKDFFL